MKDGRLVLAGVAVGDAGEHLLGQLDEDVAVDVLGEVGAEGLHSALRRGSAVAPRCCSWLSSLPFCSERGGAAAVEVGDAAGELIALGDEGLAAGDLQLGVVAVARGAVAEGAGEAQRELALAPLQASALECAFGHVQKFRRVASAGAGGQGRELVGGGGPRVSARASRSRCSSLGLLARLGSGGGGGAGLGEAAAEAVDPVCSGARSSAGRPRRARRAANSASKPARRASPRTSASRRASSETGFWDMSSRASMRASAASGSRSAGRPRATRRADSAPRMSASSRVRAA